MLQAALLLTTVANAQDNCKCVVCGVPCNSPASAHTNPACPVYKNYHSNKGGSSSAAKSPSFEQQILFNIFSNIIDNMLSKSEQQIAQEKQEEEFRRQYLADLLAKQKRYNDSIAQVRHEKMMKDYKPLEGNSNLSYKRLDDKPKMPQVHFNCKITSFKGKVVVVKLNGQKITLSETQSADLAPGDWIATGPYSRIKMHYAFESGGKDMILYPESAITIGTDNGYQVPNLMKGKMYMVDDDKTIQAKITEKALDANDELNKGIGKAKATVRKVNKMFEVKTPDCLCAIRGTEFIVNVDDFENTEVNVKEGTVDLTGTLMNGTITLTAGTKGIVKHTGEIIGPLKMDEKQFESSNQP